jgi:hypothetical protein
MSRLVLGGAAVVALIVGVYAWRDKDDAGAPPASRPTTPARDVPAGAPADTATAAPRRTAPPPRARALPGDPLPAAPDLSGAGTAQDRPPPSLAEGPVTDENGVVDEKATALRDGQALFDARDYEAAAAAGVKLVEQYPDSEQAYRIAVPSLCAIGDAEQADRLARQVRDKTTRRSIVKHCRRLGTEIP